MSHKAARLTADLPISHRAFVGAASALPEALSVPGGAARDPLEGAGAGHDREHAAQIRQWRGR